MKKRENNPSTARGQNPSRSRAARSGRIGSPVRETRNANQDRIESITANNVQNITVRASSLFISNLHMQAAACQLGTPDVAKKSSPSRFKSGHPKWHGHLARVSAARTS